MSDSRKFDNPEKRQPGFSEIQRDVVQLLAGKYLSIRTAGRLSRSCQLLWRQVKPVLDVKKVQVFLQAVADDDRKTVSTLLKINPWLILAEPQAGAVIESQLTWQRFYAENALTMAAKRKQIEMIKLLLPCYDQLIEMCEKAEEKESILNAKTKAMSAWTEYKTQNNAAGEAELVIPPAYVDIIQNLIDVFSKEKFTKKGKLTPVTKAALTQFLDMLLPQEAVKLDDYFDVELLLFAVCKMYHEQFGVFERGRQRNQFCVRVTGLIMSVLMPEAAKILCEGLRYIDKENRSVGLLAASLRLKVVNYESFFCMKSLESFYRPSRDSASGLGFEFICSFEGIAQPVPGIGPGGHWYLAWERVLLSKNKVRGELMQLQASSQALTCVIL